MRMKPVILIGMLIFGPSAMAGLVQPSAVEVTHFSVGGGRATGDMATARYSKNTVEFLGCGVRHIYTVDGTAGSFGFCEARTADSVTGVCFTEDPFLIEALASISDYSFVTFTWNAAGTCTAIGNSTQSVHLPSK
jgi:hypothetical protein